MSPEYSLCLQSIVYVPRVQFMSQSAVYVLMVQLIIQEYNICSQFMSLEYS